MKNLIISTRNRKDRITGPNALLFAVALIATAAVAARSAPGAANANTTPLLTQITILDPFTLKKVSCEIPAGRSAVVMTGTSESGASDPLLLESLQSYSGAVRQAVRIPFRPALRSPFRPPLVFR